MKGPGAAALAVVLLCTAPLLSSAGPCDLWLNFQPSGAKNVPYGWTAEGQVEFKKNKDSSKIFNVTIGAFPAPVVNVLPTHPLLQDQNACIAGCLAAVSKAGGGRRRLAGDGGDGDSGRQLLATGKEAAPKEEAPPPPACAKATDPGTLQVPATWSLSWSLDGGKKIEMGPFVGPEAVPIKVDGLAAALKGEHFLEINVAVKAETASVSGAGALPPKKLTISRKIYFNLVDSADAPDPLGPAAGAPVPGQSAGTDLAADSLASKYYCALNFNAGGKVKKNVTVDRVAEDGPLSPGAFMCARQCNKMGAECAAFGVVAGTSCYLMSSVNASQGGADSLVTAMCMKNVADWVALGAAHGVAAARDKYYCLQTFDVQGWPAGQGPDGADSEGPKTPPVTDLPLNTEPIICAGQCSVTPGCEYFVQNVPSGCYLKSRPFDEEAPYGITGPNKNVLVTCFRGEEAWTRAGSILDLALPQVPVTYAGGGVLTGAIAAGGGDAAAAAAAAIAAGGVAGAAAAGAMGISGAGVAPNATALTYYCVREYSINGTVLSKTTVGQGDLGTVACAAKCDVAGPACAAHVTDALGVCTIFKSFSLNATSADSTKFATCFKSVRDWEQFGNPDKNGMYCLKKYDMPGDGLTTRDFITITSGAGAVEFCKGQCMQVPECEFVVTQLTKCYLKNNIGAGTYGKIGASPVTDAACVKGADNWLKFALQVSNLPAAGVPVPGAPGGPGAIGPGAAGMMLPLRTRANASALADNSATARAAGMGVAAGFGGWLLMGLLGV